MAADTPTFQAALLERAAGAAEMACIHLGASLGYYKALAKAARTPAGLARATKTDVRYAREWLEQQTVAGILEVEDAAKAPAARKYRLPSSHVPVLADEDSVDYLVPLASLGVAAQAPLDQVAAAFRSGRGVPYRSYGRSFVEGQAAQNRAAFLSLLGQQWIPALPDLDRRLRSDPPARVADIGCGAAWSCIGLANAYPRVRIDGFDLDATSVRVARANVREAGLAKRVRVHERDAADPTARGVYDLVLAFECIHDLSDPVGVLRAMRDLCAPGGSVLIMDENTGPSLDQPGPFDRIFYAWSVLHCLPVGRSAPTSAATGTVMRTETLKEYALKAGYSKADVAPIQNDFFRFYRLTP